MWGRREVDRGDSREMYVGAPPQVPSQCQERCNNPPPPCSEMACTT